MLHQHPLNTPFSSGSPSFGINVRSGQFRDWKSFGSKPTCLVKVFNHFLWEHLNVSWYPLFYQVNSNCFLETFIWSCQLFCFKGFSNALTWSTWFCAAWLQILFSIQLPQLSTMAHLPTGLQLAPSTYKLFALGVPAPWILSLLCLLSSDPSATLRCRLI